MRKNILWVVILLVSATVSCKKKESEDVEKVITCEEGYKSNGETCVAGNSNYSGTYSASDACNSSGAASYSVTVTPSESDPLLVDFNGLWQVSATTITATIDVNNFKSFTAERQTIMAGFEIEIVSGTTSNNGNTIQLHYRIYATGSSNITDDCTITLTKSM